MWCQLPSNLSTNQIKQWRSSKACKLYTHQVHVPHQSHNSKRITYRGREARREHNIVATPHEVEQLGSWFLRIHVSPWILVDIIELDLMYRLLPEDGGRGVVESHNRLPHVNCKIPQTVSWFEIYNRAKLACKRTI